MSRIDIRPTPDGQWWSQLQPEPAYGVSPALPAEQPTRPRSDRPDVHRRFGSGP